MAEICKYCGNPISYGHNYNCPAEEISTLRAQLAEAQATNVRLREACAFASYKLESARIWGGMNWHWNPLSPVHYRPAYDMLRAALGE